MTTWELVFIHKFVTHIYKFLNNNLISFGKVIDSDGLKVTCDILE